ncbi:MAG: right-handed parallel beta-helix repeat-containing protein, partial [Thermoplasmatales archaeon]
MNKYIVPILVILLLLSSSFLGSSYSIEDIERTSILSFDGKTLYVGGSGPGNYSTIQDAIDDATDGDTVFVFDNSSPYYEHVIVNKSINLIGENRDTTVIDGNRNGTAVQITADWIGLSGFTIQNTSGGFPGGFQCGINLGSNYNIITGNIISNCRFFPIRLLNSNSNNITGNIISNNGCGMNIDGSSSNTITGNTISSNAQYGIRLHGWNNNNTITGN